MNKWSIGSSERERLTVTVLSAPAKDTTFAYQSVRADFHIQVGGFRGDFELRLPLPDLVSFRDQLVAIYQDLKGKAELSPAMERQIEIKVDIDKLGHCLIGGVAIDRDDKGNKLVFQMKGDQTDLNRTIGELTDVIDSFRGTFL